MLKTEFRDLHPGMGQAVAERTILRKKKDGILENWGDVADRVALGNSLLCNDKREQNKEYEVLRKHIANGSLLMSGRHLQHGDKDQPSRSLEIFSNCSTSSSSFVEFLLLLSGSGVGRSYDDSMMLINWDNAPNVRCVLSETHPDFDWSAHESVRDAKHKYGNGKDVMWHTVDDSREGWAKALEIWENAAFQKIHKDKLLILDFSEVRENGRPIGGMQSRPASGPTALMNAFNKASSIKGAGLSPWHQTMYVDHYFAECVLVGGARRCCFHTYQVLTNEGWVGISDIDPDKHKVVIDGNTYDINELYDNGVQQVMNINMEDGTMHEATEEHRWYVYNHNTEECEWVKTGELSNGDYSMLEEKPQI